MKNIKRIISTVLITVVALSGTGCNMVAKTEEGINKSVVAKVGNKTITRGELDKNPYTVSTINQIKTQYGEKYAENAEAKEALKAQKTQILDAMISEEVILTKAKDMKINVDDPKFKEDATKQFDEAKKSFNDDKKFADTLKQQGYTEESLKEAFRRNAIIQKVIEESLKDVKVDDAKAKEFYDANQLQYTEKPNRIHAAHILVKTDEEAKKVKERLDKGEDFTKVAKEVSTDPTAKDNGGDLGFVNYVNSGMDEQFMTAAIALKEGEISAPIKTQFGVHVIKCIKKEEYPVKKFDAVKEEIKTNLLEQEKKKVFNDKLEQWKKDAKVETKKYEKNLV